MAGYSGTPLGKKLGIKPGMRLALISAPPSFPAALGSLPEGTTVLGEPARPMDLILLFVTAMADLRAGFAPLADTLAPAGMLWVAWPKRASRVATDVGEDAVRGHGLDVGLVDTKVCAVDDVWSGLKFVYRLKDRPART
jgi:hypothetical protein